MNTQDTIEFAVRNLLLEWRDRHPDAEPAYMINDLVFTLSVVIAGYDPDGRTWLIDHVTKTLPGAVADRVAERTSEALATLVKPGLA